MLCGDREMAEGSVWWALDKAAHYRLSNLTAIVDVNQRGLTELERDLDACRRGAETFGCAARVVDGQDVPAIDVALAAAPAGRRTGGRAREDGEGQGLPRDRGPEQLARQGPGGGGVRQCAVHGLPGSGTRTN